MSANIALPGPRRPAPLRGWLRRRTDVWLAVAAGGIIAFLMLTLPMQAALASSVVGAFIILALVDTRVSLLALLLVRATMDVTYSIPLLSATGSSNVNAAAMMAFIVLGVGFAHVASSRLNLFSVPLAKPLILFQLITLLGIALAPDHNRALQDWIRTAGTFLVYVLVVDIMRSRNDLRWVIRVMLVSAIVPVIVGIRQFAIGEGNIDTPGLVRIYGTFTHPSPYSFYLVQLIPLAVVFLLHTRSKLAQVLLALLIPGMLFCVYEAQTRGAWVGLVVAAIVYMSTRARWTLIFVPLIAGALFFGVPSIRARFDEASSSTGSVTWRQEQWADALRVASPPKLVTVGAGLGAVDVTLGNLTHNEYVRLLVETGALGLLAMVFVYVGLYRIARQAYRDASSSYERDLTLAFLMILISRVVIALSDNIIIYPALEWYFWALAGVVVAISGTYDRKVISQRPARALPPAQDRAA